MRHPRRQILLVVAVLAAALSATVLVACGGSDGDGQSAEQVLKETFTGKKKLDSGKIDVALDLTGKDKTVSNLRLNGPFQTNGDGKVPSFDFTASIGAQGQSLSAGFTSVGTAAYVTFGGKAYELDEKTFKQFTSGYTSAQKDGAGKSDSSLSAFGVDPRTWLTDAKIAGEESIGGVDTVHVTTGVKVEPLVKDLNGLLGKAGSAAGQQVPESLSPDEVAATAKTLRNVSVDVFTGKDDKTLRRIVVAFDVAGDKPIAGFNVSKVRLSLTFADLNQPQEITAPKDPQPFAGLQKQFEEFLGAAGGGAAGGGSGKSADATPSAGASSKYLACVQKAGQDITEVQKCASLIGQ